MEGGGTMMQISPRPGVQKDECGKGKRFRWVIFYSWGRGWCGLVLTQIEQMRDTDQFWTEFDFLGDSIAMTDREIWSLPGQLPLSLVPWLGWKCFYDDDDMYSVCCNNVTCQYVLYYSRTQVMALICQYVTRQTSCVSWLFPKWHKKGGMDTTWMASIWQSLLRILLAIFRCLRCFDHSSRWGEGWLH